MPSTLYKGLEDGEIDIIISEPHSDTVRYKNIFIRSENLLIAAPKQYDIKSEIRESSKFPIIQLKDIGQHPVITLSPRHHFGNIIRTLFELEDFLPNYTIECRRIELAHSFVARGLGVTLVPEMYIENAEKKQNVEYFIVDRHRPTRNIALIYSKNRFLTEPEKHFINLFLKRFSNNQNSMT